MMMMMLCSALANEGRNTECPHSDHGKTKTTSHLSEEGVVLQRYEELLGLSPTSGQVEATTIHVIVINDFATTAADMVAYSFLRRWHVKEPKARRGLTTGYHHPTHAKTRAFRSLLRKLKSLECRHARKTREKRPWIGQVVPTKSTILHDHCWGHRVRRRKAKGGFATGIETAVLWLRPVRKMKKSKSRKDLLIPSPHIHHHHHYLFIYAPRPVYANIPKVATGYTQVTLVNANRLF